jgi:teichuronic acid biosynthesis glycosyltransferase TuaC
MQPGAMDNMEVKEPVAAHGGVLELPRTSGSVAACAQSGATGPRILSLCCLYPNPSQPRLGLFVQRRLQALAQLTDLVVVSPIAVVQYGNPKGERLRLGHSDIPGEQQNGRVTILYPRWFYPPFSGGAAPVWLFLCLVFVLARIRKKFPFEILDTHFGYPEGIAGALLSSALGVPFTMTFRGNEPKHSVSRLGRFGMTWAVRRASRIFAVSERLRQFAIGLGASPEKAKTIPNGIDPAEFFPRDRTSCRIKLGLPLDRPIIVSAGALVERKGHHRIIKALKSIAASGFAAQLVIAGGPGPEGQYERTLRDLVAHLRLESAVRFLGSVSGETMAEIMSAADIFCLASTNEGWPNVVHEALACGAPVVATDVGAVPEMLAGGNGLIVPVNDQSALERALQEALARNWDRQAISAWGHGRSWDQVAGEVFAEMQNILKQAKTAA